MKIHVVNAQKNTDDQRENLQTLAKQVMDVLRDKKQTVGFAESCTGGLLSSEITKISGASEIFWGSIVSYDNSVKQKVLNVSFHTLQTEGAVSASTARQMAEGALRVLGSHYAVAITGIAGPNGGSVQKPVGTVFIAVAGINRDRDVHSEIYQHEFGQTQEAVSGRTKILNREEIQQLACKAALKHLRDFLKR